MEGDHLNKLKPKHHYRKPDPGDEVVITGMAGKFPDSHDIYHFRDNLFNKVDLVSGDFRRWKNIHPEVPQRTGKLFDVEKFDAGCFGVTALQSDHMDPMVRLLLERSSEAIIDAGYDPSDFEGSKTGVFVGACFSETEKFVFYENSSPDTDAITGAHRSMMARRLSYCLKLKGPTFVLDTACSSSLFALAQAYNSIREGLCDKAIVCASHLCLHPIVSLQFKRLGVLSADGTCKSFDANGDGYARSEAVVALVVERAKDAARIYSEIVYAKTNCDGYKTEGITFPSSDAQKVLLKEFYDECGVDRTTLTYMEAHGTGTKVGDPEELATLDEVFCKDRDRPLHIGTIKSNIGHSEPASGLCSVVKVIIGIESGFIPPNMNYEKPREGAKGLEEGRMLVVTEKMPLPDQRGLFGINSFGFGGGNSHVLLRWNPKAKIDDGKPKDELPRLICVSSRAENGVSSILDDYRTRRCDVEFTYLIHRAFRKPVNHLYKGYGIYNKSGEVKRSLERVKLKRQKLYLVFSNFDKEWLKVGNQLMNIPVFAESIKSIQNILLEEVGIEMTEIINNLSEENLINQILGSVAIQISLLNILKAINLVPDHMIGFGSGEFAAAYLDNYLSLKQTILGLFYVASISINKTNNKNLENLERILPSRKNSYNKWIPAQEEKLNYNCAKYFANNLINVTNGLDLKKLVPNDVFTLVIGSLIPNFDNSSLHLINSDSKDYVVDLFTSLGSLYVNGFDMELDKLYPPIQLPVSRGTPMLSPLIKWNQSDWNVHLYKNQAEIKSGHRVLHITPKGEDWNFITGHVVDGRNLFPATGYLVLVWESFAIMTGKLLSEMKVVFEDVKYIRASNIPKDGSLELMVMLQTGTQMFEIAEGGSVVVTGRIFEKTSEQDFVALPSILNDQLTMTEKDVYKELKLRGYHYTGKFRAIRKCSVDTSQAIIQWEDNWISFMDCALQIAILQRDSRSTFVPTSISQLTIDAPKHIDLVTNLQDMVPVQLCKDTGYIRAGGVEIKGVGPSAIVRRKGGNPVLEISKFIANDSQFEFQDSIRSLVQVILENSNMVRVKVVETCTEKQDENNLVCPVIQESLNDLPLIQQDITVLTSKLIDFPGITIQNKPLSSESQCLILIVKDLLETTDISVAVNVIKDVKGFVISRESLDVDLSKFSNSPFTVFCVHRLEKETLILLRAPVNVVHEIKFLDLSNIVDKLDFWVPKLQELLKEQSNVVLFAQDEKLSGLLGLVTCLRRESHGGRISCVFIMDEAPKFDPKLPFYKKQLEKNMAINIWKDGSWGTYRHLAMPQTNLVENEHCYVNVTTRGDLSTLTWLEGKLSPDDSAPFEEENVFIYYTALNFRDLMTASGKIPPDAVTTDRIEQECIQGFEFVGRNSKGERIMGTMSNGSLATLITSKVVLPVPDTWTMEDAATVMVTYGTVYEILFCNFDVKPDQSILIHSGTGGVGLSAINLCLHYGLNIFVTVGTAEKRDFLREHYPQIREEHIGNSRDTSFEDMIHKHTNGRGVDYVLNSLAEEKLLASVRCLAKGGKFLEIGKFDISSNSALALHLLERDAQFVGMALDKSLKYLTNLRALKDLIDKGAIKPLPRTVFEMNEVEKAFRYMGTGKHIGKVLIKIREEEPEKVCPVKRKLFKAAPRFYCKPECSYVIYGGLGGFGLELADLLVIRGARKLVLTSRSGVCNGYQRYRIRIWESYGVTVDTTIRDATTEEGCIELLNKANELGPVDGIFNLAVVLKDALFENQTAEEFREVLMPKAYCTKNFDNISRKLCPNLRYFVVFSSISCGRGNIGQTNYGMANSIMERICEKRKEEGYPALAIQWGAIGEVGLVAKMQEDHRELVIGGTLQQRISSCLEVMDLFLRQDEPIVGSMLVAEKRYGGKASNLFEEVINIMGVTNLKSVSMHATFPELGMDSMTAVEIKQTLEREYEVFLTAQDIRTMTLARLKDLSNAQDSLFSITPTVSQDTLPIDIQLLLRYVGNQELSHMHVIKMKTMLDDEENGDDAPHVICLPGIEGTATVLEPLCSKLKAHVSCIQYCVDDNMETITQLANSLLPHIEECGDEDLIILAYSFGAVVAAEVLAILESKGRNAKVIYIDGSPHLMTDMVDSYFSTNDENLFQILLLSGLMMRYMPYEEILKHQGPMMKIDAFHDKINYIISVSPKVDMSNEHIINMCTSSYKRLKALSRYKVGTQKLRSQVTLFKAKTTPLTKAAADYGLSNNHTDNVHVFTMDGNHVTILENDDLAAKINLIISD